MWLGSAFFCVIISIIVVAIFDKKIYLLGILLIFPSIVFFYKMAINQPEVQYLEAERICGVYAGSFPLASSRASSARGYGFNVKKYGEFVFSSRNNYYGVNLDSLKKGEKVCLLMQRRKDKANNLNLANLLSIE
jgi:energy-coupling factor transporter transmembrane protein EcfT